MNMTSVMKTRLNVVKAMLTSWPEISEQRVADVLDVLAVKKIARLPDPIPVFNLEPVIKQKDAAKMLGVTTKALVYHVRKGRIRVVKPEGAKRAMGYVAADIRALLNGTANA